MSERDDARLDVAARLSVAASRRAAAQLRVQAPRPYGLAPGAPQPPPAFVSFDQDLSPLRVARGFLARSPAPVATVTLTYGTSRDLAADLIEITTDYTRRHDGACPLEYELGLAEHRDAAIARGDAVVPEPPFGLGGPAGPLGRSATALLVDGRPRDAEILTCGRYRALRFEQGPLLVTVVSRNELPERPAFARVSDLEPFLANAVTDLETAREMWRTVHAHHEAHMDAWRRGQAVDDL